MERPPRSATAPIMVKVSAPLTNFGYSFFVSARALIDYRLAVVRSGIPGMAATDHTGQAAANLPIITSPSAGGLVSPAQNPTTASTVDPAVATKATGGTGATQGTPPIPLKPVQSNPVDSGNPRSPLPSGVVPAPGLVDSGDNSPSADALRYFVGPFDMLGLNVFVPAPERYQLGPGDILTIRYWSPAVEEAEVDAKVDGRGEISVPVGGRKVVVRGQTLQQAEQLLKHELRLDLKNGQVTITLKALRTMSITVLGDAYLPGSYQVPAVATLFNALYMFGGPSNTGSLRGIQLRRSDGTTLTFDLYKFLVFGDAKQDVPLQPGDTIWIPPSGPRVTVQGEVLRPGIYEAAKGENLRSVIAFAGGPRATGVLQRVSVQTIEPAVGRQLRDIDLSATAGPESDTPVF